MVKIKAHIKLFKNGRKTPFYSGYRPLFDFKGGMKTSGQIELIDVKSFFPGEDRDVIIVFLNKEYLGSDFGVGKKFVFGEGPNSLGDGVVSEILEAPH